MSQHTLFTGTETFDGATVDPAIDWERLNTLQGRVYRFMQDGQWRTLRSIADRCGGSEASVSARLRDLRKEKWGKHTVDRKRFAGGLFFYRVADAR